jgi:hypothetical protein
MMKQMKQKNLLFAGTAVPLTAALILAGCPSTDDGTTDKAVSLLSLNGNVTAPVKDAAPPVTAAIDTEQYTGTVVWQTGGGAAFTGGAFAASTVYRALVTLGAKTGYTFTGVAANSFTYTGAATVTNAANSGVITITFPATAAVGEDTVVNLLSLDGKVTAPVKNATPVTTAIDTTQYTGTIVWQNSDGTAFTGAAFAASTVYRALVTLVAKTGYTFTGVAANSFTCAGAAAVTSAANSGVITVTFPATEADASGVSLSGLAGYLASLASNTAATPHTVTLAASVTINTADTSASGVWATINSTVQTAGKYVILDLSACSAAGNTITGVISLSPTNNLFNIIEDNTYIKGVTLPSTLAAIGNSAFYYCTNLTSVTIPDGVASIGTYAFAHCTGLTSVTIPGSVTSIGGGAFGGCTGLTSVTIPGSVTSIGGSAFQDCTHLTSVTIPGSVTSLVVYTFDGCTSLNTVIFGTGSDIANSEWDGNFPYGASLWTAYSGGASRAGTYKRSGSTWAQQ